eukprot:4599819-Amphidinium_carterae.1
MEHPYGFDPAYEEADSYDVYAAENQQDWLYPTVQGFAYVGGGKPSAGPWSGAHLVTTKVPPSRNGVSNWFGTAPIRRER